MPTKSGVMYQRVLFIKQILKDIPIKHYDQARYVEIVEEGQVELCIIKVKKLPKKYQPARLLDNKEEKIYIRNGNATEHLVGNKLIRYFERLRR